jgi:hypothetical protein
MTDQPEGQQPESANSVTTVSGGVNANAEQINVGADVVGRDKTISAGTYIEHYYAGSEAVPSKSTESVAKSRMSNKRIAIGVAAGVALAGILVLVLIIRTRPVSEKISFNLPTTNANLLNPSLEWEAGSSALSHYAIYTDALNLVADSHTWPFFPSIRYKSLLEDDFDVQVRVVFTSPFQTVPTAQMAGIVVRPVGARLVMGDSSFPENWIVGAKQIVDAGRLVGCRGAWADYSSDVVYVRVKRTGDSWYCGYSDNDVNWRWLAPRVDPSLSKDMPMEMALFAYSETDDKLSVEFSDWIITR